MILQFTKFNRIYLYTKIAYSPSCFIIKRNVGEIVPKNFTSFSRQVLILTGGNTRYVTNNCLVPAIRQGTTLIKRPLYPYDIRTTQSHRSQIDYRYHGTVEKTTQLDSIINQITKKPSEQPQSESITPTSPSVSNQITLTNYKNETYTTSINEQSTPDQFTVEQLLEELRIRGLCKEDNNHTEVKILLKDNTSETVGLSKNKMKLTPMGRAYEENLPKPPGIIFEQTNPCPKQGTTKFIISVPPKSTEETIIDGGKQKHLILVQDQENKDYMIALGYLTSKKSGILLTDKQFKNFQNEMSGINSVKNIDKTQHVALFEIPLKIKKEDIKEAAWDDKYFSEIPKPLLIDFLKKVEEKWIKGFKDFSKNALTKIEILQMCKDYDNIVTKKGKHPLTTDQIKQQEEAKKQQQENQKEDKKNKQKNNHDS